MDETKELLKRTTWRGTHLDNGRNPWEAFPVLRLDGKNDVVVINGADYKLNFAEGCYLLRRRESNE